MSGRGFTGLAGLGQVSMSEMEGDKAVLLL
jgi:hypothetical protein